MKRFFTLVAAVIAALLYSCAESDHSGGGPSDPHGSNYTVTLDEARDAVEELLVQIDVQTRGGSDVRKIRDCYIVGENISTRGSALGETPLVYIFNFEGDRGYAIASADRRTSAEVFALTDRGYLDPEKGVSVPGMAALLANMEELYRAETSRPDAETRAADDYSEWTVAGHYGCDSKVAWGQYSPYNDLAPQVDGRRAAAGCTATALAQVMMACKYPLSYDGHEFDWEEMGKQRATEGPDSYCEYPPAYGMIARLFQVISTPGNLDMQWGYASGAYLVNAVRTLENMGYSSPGTFENYNTARAEEHLRGGRSPIPVSAYREEKPYKKQFLGINVMQVYSYSGGHTFVVEEMMVRERTATGSGVPPTETQILVKVNWGWDGQGNGYFYNGMFDMDHPVIGGTPGDTGYNYRYLMQMVIGIGK